MSSSAAKVSVHGLAFQALLGRASTELKQPIREPIHHVQCPFFCPPNEANKPNKPNKKPPTYLATRSAPSPLVLCSLRSLRRLIVSYDVGFWEVETWSRHSYRSRPGACAQMADHPQGCAEKSDVQSRVLMPWQLEPFSMTNPGGVLASQPVVMVLPLWMGRRPEKEETCCVCVCVCACLFQCLIQH